MADWNTPTLASTYTSVLDTLKNRDLDAALMFDPAFVTITNVPTNTVRWNSATSVFEKFNGTSWAALTATYNINVSQLGGQNGAYYLAWANLTGVPATFAPSAHTHDDRYYTETESDARYGNNLFVSGNTIQLRTPGNTVLTTLTVPFATNAGTVGGFSVGQNLNTNSNVSFGTIVGTLLDIGSQSTAADASVDVFSGTSQATSLVRFSAGGAELRHVGTAGGLSIITEGAVNLVLSTTNTERVRVTSGGDVQINVASGGNLPGRLVVVAATLGTTSGNTSDIAGFSSLAGTNAAGLVTRNRRYAAGTDFNTVESRVQYRVDTTEYGYVGFRSDAMTFGTGASTEHARIDSSGRLLIGATATSASPGSVNPDLQLHDTGSSASQSITRWSANATSPFFYFQKSRGAAIGTRGAVVSADELGSLFFAGDDGTNFVNGATIRGMVDGTVTTGGMPSRIEFRTSAAGSGSPSERMRITSAGDVGIGTQTPASLLDVNGTVTAGTLRLPAVALTLASTTHPFQIGSDASINLVMDNNDIQVRSNGAASTLNINPLGGNVTLGIAASTVTIVGTLSGDMSLAAGFSASTKTLTAATSFTPTPTGSHFQTITNSGAFTITAPSAAGNYTIVIRVTNAAGAGAVTLSGFSRVTGDTFTTVSTHNFLVFITRLGASVIANVVAAQ